MRPRRHDAEADHRLAERWLSAVIEGMSDGVFAAAMDGTMKLWNHAATEIVGIGATDIEPDSRPAHYGAFLPDAVTPLAPEDAPSARALRGERTDQMELFIRNAQRPDGVWVSASGTPVYAEDGEQLGAVIVFRDITRLKSVENELSERAAELEAVNRELEAFSYSVSHDLRAPLRAIDGFGRRLADGLGEELDDGLRHYLDRIRTGAAQMGRLIDDLLAFSKLTREPLRRERIDVAALVRDVLNGLMEAEERGVDLSIMDLPPCDADPAMMRQVFQNLLSNAIKFTRTRDPAQIEVGAYGDGPGVTYFVRDNGIGFDPRFAEKAFDTFQRLHLQEDYEGTGIGLALVRRIVTRHGGRVWAEAVPDGGATIFFSIDEDRAT